MAKQNYFWAPEQVSTLQSAYRSGGLKQAQAALPEIPRGALATKACRLKITNPKPRKPK
jgi:hypothetical protein